MSEFPPTEAGKARRAFPMRRKFTCLLMLPGGQVDNQKKNCPEGICS